MVVIMKEQKYTVELSQDERKSLQRVVKSKSKKYPKNEKQEQK